MLRSTGLNRVLSSLALMLCLVACHTNESDVMVVDRDAINLTTDALLVTDGTVTDAAIAIDTAVPEMDSILVDASTGTDLERPTSASIEIQIDGRAVSNPHVVDIGVLEQHADAFYAFTLTNTGQTALNIFAVELGPTIELVMGSVPATLEYGERIALTLRIQTREAIPIFTEDVLIVSDAPNHSDFSIQLTGSVRAYVRDVASPNLEFKAAIESIRRDAGLVGLAAAVVRGRDIIALEGVGFSDREANIEVDPRQTMFRWASVAKSMGAIAALRRAEDVDLDVSIQTYFPAYEVPGLYLQGNCRAVSCATELPEAERSITLRQLFSHRGGIQHYTDGVRNPTPRTVDVNDPMVNTGMEWAIANFVHNPLVAPPGSVYNYSSFGYNLAGVVLEKALNMPYEMIVIDQVARPIGASTLVADRFWENIPNRSVGYRFASSTASEPVRDGNTDVSWKLAGGGFISTIVDLARYCGALQDEVLISSDQKSREFWADIYDQNYGLGIGVSSSRGNVLISHTGAQQKAASSLRLYPERNECVVMMSNTRPQSSRTGFDSAGDIGRLVDFAWQALGN